MQPVLAAVRPEAALGCEHADHGAGIDAEPLYAFIVRRHVVLLTSAVRT